jgi:hypothetical protein
MSSGRGRSSGFRALVSPVPPERISEAIRGDRQRSSVARALVSPVPPSRNSEAIRGPNVPFNVSPGRGNLQQRKKWQSSYLDKPSGPPRGSVVKSSATPVSPHQFGGSYLNTPGTMARMSISRMSFAEPFEETPDVKIEVTIPDIDKKIRARRARQRRISVKKEAEENVPEHIRRFREREKRAIEAREKKELREKQLVAAYFYAWKARAQYPRIRQENEEILNRVARERALQKVRIQSAIKIQKTFRMFVPRKRHIHVIACKRRRERNQREIKRIERKLAKMPRDTKDELKAMKKEYAEKKKELKQKMRSLVDGEGKKAENMKEQGQNMIKYLQHESRNYKEKQMAIERDQKLLVKQFDMLTQKSEHISQNFQSLQNFVIHKNQSIQKNEIASQKCRHRYLPRYRKDLAERNNHCVAEYRVKMLYKAKVEKIGREIKMVSTDREIYKDAKKALKAGEKEIASRPVIPVPPELSELLD